MAYYNVGDCDLFAISIVYSLYRCSYIINATESYRVVLPTPRRLCFHRCSLVSLFVNRITQKPHNRFSQNLAEGWHMCHGRNHYILMVIWIMLC